MYPQILDLLSVIKNKEVSIHSLLQEYESSLTADHEIFLSIDCLENISKESQYLSQGKVKDITVFLPMNLPLYSLTIFCIIPSLMSEQVSFRCPKALEPLFTGLLKILEIDLVFPALKLSSLSRRNFIEGVASVSDVIIFTGKYENAIEIKNQCPTSLFIYNGASVNPILIGQNANLDLAVEKTIAARTFNSGQDCAGPDAILVPKENSQEFIEKLSIAVKKLQIGNYHDKDVQIGKLISPDTLVDIQKMLHSMQKSIVLGGKIDVDENTIEPTIVVENLSENSNYVEFFCPIFYVSVYSSNEELNNYFDSPLYKDYAMYLSVFGNIPDGVNIPNTVILNNQILLDIEKGNEEYGGYGYKANFVASGSNIEAKPVLISREIANWIKKIKKEEVL